MNDGIVGDRPRAAAESGDTLRHALLDSRQRWRDLVSMVADLAYETDEWGRLVFVMPDPALGWPAGTLVGQPAELLLRGGTNANGFNPFRVTTAVRRRRAWLNKADGSAALLAFSAAPLLDAEGRIVGSRGIGVDWTEYDAHQGVVSATLRRGEVLDHVLWRVGQEVLAPRMMQAGLDALVNALGAEGAAVIDLHADAPPLLAHQAGGGGAAVLAPAAALLAEANGPAQVDAPDGRPILVVACRTRFGAHAGLALWRVPGSRGWDNEDKLLVNAAASVIRMALEHEAIQQEMGRQARTDPLTGLLNRRAFLEELERHLDRLEREHQPGALIFADLDFFKPVNDRLGHDVGDQVLQCTANLLRKAVRPTDLVARLGGDEFAIWMNGADHLTAAERADWLTVQVPIELRKIAADVEPTPTMSIGIAARLAGSGEPISSLLRRADRAMYDVKRTGRGRWQVSHEVGG
jgi:diguanylate cyclase (GGDEF)-like protein